MEQTDPDALIADAETKLDHAEQVLAAGWFEIQKTSAAVGGAMVGSAVGGSTGNLVGLVLGEKAYAESSGMTERVLVAVTPTHVMLLNGDTKGRLPVLGASFERSSCDIVAKNFGPMLSIHIEDPADGRKLKLNGSTLSKPDRAVENVLKK